MGFVNDEIDRVEAAGRDRQELRVRLEDICRSYCDFIDTDLREARQSSYINVPGSIDAPDLGWFAYILWLELDVYSASQRLPERIQRPDPDAYAGIIRTIFNALNADRDDARTWRRQRREVAGPSLAAGVGNADRAGCTQTGAGKAER